MSSAVKKKMENSWFWLLILSSLERRENSPTWQILEGLVNLNSAGTLWLLLQSILTSALWGSHVLIPVLQLRKPGVKRLGDIPKDIHLKPRQSNSSAPLFNYPNQNILVSHTAHFTVSDCQTPACYKMVRMVDPFCPSFCFFGKVIAWMPQYNRDRLK